MKLSQAVELWLTSVIAENRSEETRKWYRHCLRRLCESLLDPELSQISLDDLRRFVADLRSLNVRWANHRYRKPTSGGLSPSTLQGYVRSIKRLYNWLVENDYLMPEENIAAKLKRPIIPKQPPKEMTDEDFYAMLAAARQSPYSQRDLAIILFLADTGCRVGGLVNLEIKDLNLELGRCLITEKGRKSRFVFFHDPTKLALRDWLTVRQSSNNFLFVGRRQNQLTVWGVHEILERIAKSAGVKGRYNPHSLRHRFAKKFLMAGGDLASLSNLMGHADTGVTSKSYAVFLTEELKRKHDQYSAVGDIPLDQ